MKVQKKVRDYVLEWSADRPHLVWVIPQHKTFIRSQSGIQYDSGAMGWDYPEILPQYVLKVAPRFLAKCREGVQ